MTRIPFTDAADALLARLAAATGIAMPDGATLLGERAALNGFLIPGRTSAGGGCRLYDATDDDTIALNLARPADRELLPALFGDDGLDPEDDEAIANRIASRNAGELIGRGREMGLAIAAILEPFLPRQGEVSAQLTEGEAAPRQIVGRQSPFPSPSAPPPPGGGGPRGRPRIVDLSALWAGPLATHLLHLAGAEVLKVESPARPDAMRAGQPAFYDLLNQGKASVALDPRDPADRAALLDLIAHADIVVEAARPRALLQLGIDADALVAAHPRLVWLTVTAYGMTSAPAHWVGFGDDVGVAAGLSAALHDATGTIGFVGDAIADPLTGIAAALAGHAAWADRRGGRIGIAMRDVAAAALAAERENHPAALDADLRAWADAVGRPFPAVRHRAATPARPFGGDPPRWRPRC